MALTGCRPFSDQNNTMKKLIRVRTQLSDNLLIKYQGVKEFYMLARVGGYCNITVFSPFKVKVTYYHPLNQPLVMGIRPQNMPQISNSLLSPIKSMVARSNQW